MGWEIQYILIQTGRNESELINTYTHTYIYTHTYETA